MQLKMQFAFRPEVFLPAQDLARALGTDFNALLEMGLVLVLEAHRRGVLKKHMKLADPIMITTGGKSGKTDVQ
jgi:hypothetical protein